MLADPVAGSVGLVTLWANDRPIGAGQMARTVPLAFTSYAGMDISRENGLVVDGNYEEKAPYAFTGTVKEVVFDLKPVAPEDGEALHKHAAVQAIGCGAADERDRNCHLPTGADARGPARPCRIPSFTLSDRTGPSAGAASRQLQLSTPNTLGSAPTGAANPREAPRTRAPLSNIFVITGSSP